MRTQDQTQKTILVVDKNPLSLEKAASILEKEGYAVCSAPDSRKCMDNIRQIQPDLILMDLVLSESDGIETCRRLKSDPTLQSIPVVFMISGSNMTSLENAYQSGGSDFVRKPLNRIELMARVDLLLKMHRNMELIAEAEKLEIALEEAGGVCHKLNQPLQFVMGSLQILLMDMSPEEEMFKRLDTIREKVEQMGNITRNLIAVISRRPKLRARGPHASERKDRL